MNTIGFVQTKDKQIFELVDELSNYYDEYHAQLFIEYYPNKYIKVVDRNIGVQGVFEIENVRVIFRFKKKNY